MKRTSSQSLRKKYPIAKKRKPETSLGSKMRTAMSSAFSAYSHIGSGTARAIGTGLRRRGTMRSATGRRK